MFQFFVLLTGIDASGIPKVTHASSCYAIPIVVCTGIPYSTYMTKQIPTLDHDGCIIMNDRYFIIFLK
jgi:hypothetical protein